MHFHGKKKRFIELVEKIMVRWGYTNTEGRIYGILLMSESPLTIKDLLNLTDLSRTSISTSLKRLVREDVVNVRKEKRVKYFSPNPIFTEKFMEQPREMLTKEVEPLVKITDELFTGKSPEYFKNKMIEIKKDLETLKNLLETIIKIEENNFNS